MAGMTKDEEIISAAVLHDTIEDCEGVTADVLALEFSPRVAGMVLGESEDKSKDMDGKEKRNHPFNRTGPKRGADDRSGR